MRVSELVGQRRVDLNVDIGEGFPFDDALLAVATSANVGCGVHAGSRDLTERTVAQCRERGVRVGAHPGYPDRASMGRRSLDDATQRSYLTSLLEQVTWFARALGADYLKPHGAFYGDTGVRLPDGWRTRIRPSPISSAYESEGAFLAQFPGVQTLMMLLRVHHLPLMGLPDTAHEEVARRAGQPFLREGFADRAYAADGTLLPRSSPQALLTDRGAIRDQVLRLAPFVDSICLHGDAEGCVERAEWTRRALEDHGYEVGA